MSEPPKTKTVKSALRASLLVILAIIFLLVIGYISGYFILPRSIQSAYRDKDCASTLSRYELFMNVYSRFIPDKSPDDHVIECAVYTLAGMEEQNGAWHAAYNAYRVYLDRYPNGAFVEDANYHISAILIKSANEQLSEKKYSAAMESLDLAVSQNANTDAADAEKTYAEIYQSWGADLREAGDFEGAESVFTNFKEWAQSRQKTEQAASAQRELAQTYLAWGLSLQSQKRFEDALTKFDLASSTDPDPQSDSSPAWQVKANQIKFYKEWGDHLIGQKDFSGAMGMYAVVGTFSEGSDSTAAQDVMAEGYVQWAAGVSGDGDFIGALVLLDFAEMNAATESTKEMVADARQDVYLAFSESSGEQALQAINQAVRIVCEHHIQPQLPIFGLDQGNIRVSVYGVDGQLPESLAATTPDSLHYVTCIDKDTSAVPTI